MVVFRLLDHAVAAELVSATIQHKVTPYVQTHGLDLDTVLLNYVKVWMLSQMYFIFSILQLKNLCV